MDLASLLRILLRRWLVLVPVLGITAASAFYLTSSIKPDYESTAVVLLIGATDPTGDTAQETNPLEELRPLNTVAQALAIITNDASVRQDLSDQGLVANYQVTVTPETPILGISARAKQQANAIASRDALIELLRKALEARQRSIGAPEPTFIRAETISESPGARPITAARDRALVGILALGAAAAVAAAVVVDQLVAQRKLRAQEEIDAAAGSDAESTPDDDTGTASPEPRARQLTVRVGRDRPAEPIERAENGGHLIVWPTPPLVLPPTAAEGREPSPAGADLPDGA